MDKTRMSHLNIWMALFMVMVGIIMVVLATMDIVNYAVASIFVGVALIVPFLVIFERRPEKCKMLVLIATLSSIAIVGRWVFAWLPNVTLSTGIVILAGVSLGAVPGFMVGALTMLVSNMLLGQGLWTVWQMLMVGLIGLGAGLMRRADKIALTVYAVLMCFVYGFVMDIFTLVTVYNDITIETFLVVWAASFYFDLVHAVSSVLAVVLLYNVIVPTVRRRLDI